MEWRKFINTPSFFGSPGEPKDLTVDWMDFLYIAQKKTIPTPIYKIGITGGDRKLGKGVTFLWKWQLIKPRLIEDMVKKQLKLFRSGWLKDSEYDQAYEENDDEDDNDENNDGEYPPLSGNFNSIYEKAYEYTTEVFNSKIDLFTLIHLVRLNILAVYAHVGLIKKTKKLAELHTQLNNTPFGKIWTFSISVESPIDFYIQGMEGKEKLLDEQKIPVSEFDNSYVVGRKVVNEIVEYLFVSRIDSTNFKWIKLNDLIYDRTKQIEKIKEFMINRMVYYKDPTLSEFKIINQLEDDKIKWKIQRSQGGNEYIVEDKYIKLLEMKNICDLEKMYTDMGFKMRLLHAYTKEKLTNETARVSMKVVDYLQEQKLFKVETIDGLETYYVKEDDIKNDTRLIDKFNSALTFDAERTLMDLNQTNTSTLMNSNVSNQSNTVDTNIDSQFDTANIPDQNGQALNIDDLTDRLVGKYIVVKYDMDDDSKQYFEGKVLEKVVGKENTYNVLFCEYPLQDNRYVVEDILLDSQFELKDDPSNVKLGQSQNTWYIIDEPGDDLKECEKKYKSEN